MRVAMRKTTTEFLARECDWNMSKTLYKDEYSVTKRNRGGLVSRGTFAEIESFVKGAVSFKRSNLATI